MRRCTTPASRRWRAARCGASSPQAARPAAAPPTPAQGARPAAIRPRLSDTVAARGYTAAPPYREPTDPVFVLSGADVTIPDRHRPLTSGGDQSSGNDLPCRLDHQVVTAVTLEPGLVPGSTQEVVQADALPGLAVLPDQAPAALIQSLLREVILLSPPLQPLVAAACAAHAVPGHPAVLAFAATVSPPATAAQRFVADLAPNRVAHAGPA